MGMYDTVRFTCPQCEGVVEHQSKAGKCEMVDIDESVVPLVVAADIENETVWCEECQRSWRIVKIVDIQTVGMRLVKP